MKPRIDSTAFLWLALVLGIALAIAFLLPVTTQDYWWYLRVGRDTLASGAVPRTNTLSLSQAGAPFVYHSWGAAVLFWLLYKAGGLTLTVLVRGLLLALACGLVWRTARHLGAGRIASALVLLLAVLASSNNWSVRPQLFAYPLFALALYILYRWQEGNKKALWVLPLIGLLWVNLHGSFVMLVLLAGAALVFGGGDRRALGLAFAGVLLASLLNPRGLGAWAYVFQSVTVPSSQLFSAEWRPPVNQGWQMNLFFLWLLAFPLLAVVSPRKLSRLEWAWFLGFGTLALWGLRYVVWFIFVMTILTACLVSAALEARRADREPRRLRTPPGSFPAVDLTFSLLFLLLPLALLPGLRERWWAAAPPAAEATPTAATEWLAAHPDLPGPLWSEIGFSSYLEFALPERRPWMDTRFEAYPVEGWQAYADVSNASYNWDALLSRTGAGLVMVSVDQQPDLLAALAGSTHWAEIYRDDTAVIFGRNPGGDQ